MRYSEESKSSIITKILPPNNQSLSLIQQETGVPEGTLKLWRKELALSQRREKEIEKELKQVKKELRRKESALAETAALLVLRKNINAI